MRVVFRKNADLFDKEMSRLVSQGKSPFDFPGLRMVQTVEESKALNRVKGTTMIIAGSGMCTGGRVKHHLVTNISRRESTVLFVGYQAAGTLGRQIAGGSKRVRILGHHYPVRAEIAQLHSFSSHADRDGLLRWLSGLKRPPRRVFVVHGETKVATQFGRFLKEKTGWKITVPRYRTEVTLE